MNLQVRRVYLLGQLSVCCCCVYNLGDLTWRCGIDPRHKLMASSPPIETWSLLMWLTWSPLHLLQAQTPRCYLLLVWPLQMFHQPLVLAMGQGCIWGPIVKLLIHIGAPPPAVDVHRAATTTCWMIAILSTPGTACTNSSSTNVLVQLSSCCWEQRWNYTYTTTATTMPMMQVPMYYWALTLPAPYYYDYNITGNVACDRHLFVFITGLIWAALLNKPTVNNQMQYPHCYHSF